jgi:hypothetical protein
MSIEAGVVIGSHGVPLHWHLPPGRNVGYLPDSKDLWQVLWENRERLYGFAHSHPGSGEPSPSWEDLTTFAAVEKGLGRRLVWPIATADQVAFFTWMGSDGWYQHGGVFALGAPEPEWLTGLRARSAF